MTTFWLILVVLVALVGGFLVQGLVIYASIKIFKIPNITYKSSLKIEGWWLLIGIVFAIILALLGALIGLNQKSIIVLIINAVVNFYIFHFLMKRYYATEMLKNFWMYLTQLAISVGVTLIIAVLIICLRLFVAEPFTVAGQAMSPNFTNGQYIVLEHWDKNYHRGDVVVLRYPKDPSQFFIKRIIGLPGETITLQNGRVYINGQALDESGYLPTAMQNQTFGYNTPVVLGPDEYYVLGDNRTASSDSRVWGPVPGNLIIGKYWKTISSLNGKYSN